MNSFDLITLHRERYPSSHLTRDTIDTVLYQLIRLTSGIEEPRRAVLVRGTCYELVYRYYRGKEADELKELAQKRFDEIYDGRCLCLFLCLT
jgi:hypothetical protein